jgi:glycosyltransferase involved in cell wall biosynthesis
LKLLQINTTLNSGSTGRISEDIGKAAIASGNQSYIAAAYTNRPSESSVIKIGGDFDRKLHGVKSRLFDRHGFGSAQSTKELVSSIRVIKPDIIHLHNIHGYYLHIGILFSFLKEVEMPVVWTFHDCWPFTGHCSYFDAVNCHKWQTQCNHCPNIKGYPSSIGLDQSSRNFDDKQQIFNGLKSLQIVTPSQWLAMHVRQSFLSAYPVRVIHNGVDLNVFAATQLSWTIRAKYNLSSNRIVLGVASTWDKRKGLNDFIQLSGLLTKDIQIVLVGLNKEQLTDLPDKIKGIARTENMQDLAALYTAADVFINPTYVDNFPTTNIEALACGTPVITYNTGGSAESIDIETGFIVAKGDIRMLHEKIQLILIKGKEHYSTICRKRAVKYFNKDDRYADYLDLYQQLLNGKNNASTRVMK